MVVVFVVVAIVKETEVARVKKKEQRFKITYNEKIIGGAFRKRVQKYPD